MMSRLPASLCAPWLRKLCSRGLHRQGGTGMLMVCHVCS